MCIKLNLTNAYLLQKSVPLGTLDILTATQTSLNSYGILFSPSTGRRHANFKVSLLSCLSSEI